MELGIIDRRAGRNIDADRPWDLNGYAITLDGCTVLVDPPAPGEDDWPSFDVIKPIAKIVLTNRDHVRDAELFRTRFGAHLVGRNRRGDQGFAPKTGFLSETLPKTQKNPLLLPWWLKVDRRFDSPIYLFRCEEHFRIRSHCPG